ncbi:MAG: SDR family oxidoreductase [Hoeflea sp.]|uniref:SDR family oxidoreductase n=1 Tax=Hoeflea sp. TaxID=1940281 RepID=UPI0032EB3851
MNGGRTLLVTGASRGIGAATARKAAADGWRVAINYLSNREAAEQVVADIEAEGGEAFAVKGDLGSEDDILAIYKAIDDRWGRIGGLVNNAGVLGDKARVEDFDAARIERTMRVNVTGLILCSREAVRRMSTRFGGKGGSIVNISSAAARLGSANEYVDYAASKAAVDTFTRGLALEVAEEGIRVNAVRPGTTYTEIHAAGGQPDRPERVRPSVPMKRIGEPGEIADAVVYLLSEKASYVTGAHLDVSGGR